METIQMYINLIKRYPVDIYSTAYAFFLLGICKEKIDNEFEDDLFDENYKKYSIIVDELYADLLIKIKDIMGGIK